MRNTGKIAVQKVLNDVRITAYYIYMMFNQQGVNYSYFCCKYIMAIKQDFLVGKEFTLKVKWGVKTQDWK